MSSSWIFIFAFVSAGITQSTPQCQISCILQDADYEYPEWENLCTQVCNSTCLTASHFLAAKMDYKTVTDTVTVTTLTDDSMSFKVLLSNTTRFIPSTLTWKSCTHVEGIA